MRIMAFLTRPARPVVYACSDSSSMVTLPPTQHGCYRVIDEPVIQYDCVAHCGQNAWRSRASDQQPRMRPWAQVLAERGKQSVSDP